MALQKTGRRRAGRTAQPPAWRSVSAMFPNPRERACCSGVTPCASAGAGSTQAASTIPTMSW